MIGLDNRDFHAIKTQEIFSLHLLDIRTARLSHSGTQKPDIFFKKHL